MTIEIRDDKGTLLASAPTIEGCIHQLVDLCERYREIVERLQRNELFIVGDEPIFTKPPAQSSA